MAVDIWTRFVGSAPLHRLCRLAELQINTGTEAASRGDVCCTLDDDGGLLDAEHIGARVVSPQEVHAVVRAVPVVLVIPLERHAELDVLPGVLRLLRRNRRLLE